MHYISSKRKKAQEALDRLCLALFFCIGVLFLLLAL